MGHCRGRRRVGRDDSGLSGEHGGKAIEGLGGDRKQSVRCGTKAAELRGC